jgi:hypothetical protein
VREYRELTAEAELDQIVRRMHRFHDSLLKEVRVVNRAWVGADGAMRALHRVDARMLVQSQGDLRAIELVAVGVQSLELASDRELYAGHVQLRRAPAGAAGIQVAFAADGLVLTCARLFVAERPEWHGPAARLDGDVPAPDAVPARDLDHGCRQCTACTMPFDATGRPPFVYCPSCASLTMLVPAS